MVHVWFHRSLNSKDPIYVVEVQDFIPLESPFPFTLAERSQAKQILEFCHHREQFWARTAEFIRTNYNEYNKSKRMAIVENFTEMIKEMRTKLIRVTNSTESDFDSIC